MSTSNERVDHELKAALQKVVEQDCGPLMSSYGFSIRRILAVQSYSEDIFKFAVEVYSSQLQKTLTAVQALGRSELYHAGFNGSYSGEGSAIFVHLFRKIARQITDEIEKVMKEMPVVGENIWTATAANSYALKQRYADQQRQMISSMIGSSGTTYSGISGYTGMTGSIMPQMRQFDIMADPTVERNLQERIIKQFNTLDRKEPSKFKNIDALIANSKLRLGAGYASPRFQFKYF